MPQQSRVSYRYGMVRGLGNALALVFLLLWGNSAVAQGKMVIAFGDSLTQGYGLPLEQGFVPQLQSWLNGQGMDVRVVNAGVSGDTTHGGKSRIDWTLAEPADLIIVNLGGNDVLRGIDPAVSRGNLNAVMQAIAAKSLPVVLVGTLAPGNYGPDYKAEFDQIYPNLATEYGAVLYPSFFQAFLGQGDVPADLGDYIQADGLHPSAKGVAAIVADFGPIVLKALSE